LKKKRKLVIIFREMVVSLTLIIFFAFFGDSFFNFLGISAKSMQISGGIVLFIVGLNMIFPKKEADNSYGVQGEPFIFPLAVPLVAGPAVLAAVMIYSRQMVQEVILISAIIIAWAATTIILLLAGKLSQWIDKRSLQALERLMGLILLMIAIEMVLKGWHCAY
jgi:multiple antibiotic resistance protein